MDPKTFRDNANKKSAEEILIIKEETAQKIKSAESSLSSKLAILERANKNGSSGVSVGCCRIRGR